ncbi:YbaK/prolyl-tRNA synthetase associated region [Kribbella flavida DSM 17836]|uniref:YbaK/prolyl-tRNA synthetase associated region n=1 Tax=Kribbella flavida (strain DSM 17836 / JCM 10339 / NBRC 14399) TaxID=479435 RepID=D2PQX3_KRIFD|nr:YbaK/EbsC family protein [Kribbella flavida]ADB31106.1 YbaK/prolyl-tRNA synthetase associated region [Kribbella flavida DSM 17836]
MPGDDTYQRLIALFDTTQTPYRLIDHAPDGTTESVSALRGHPASHAAKCIILRIKTDRRTTRHVLAVIPGDRRVDLDAVRTLFKARYVGFSDAATAERLARSVPGTVLPFTFDSDLELVADPEVVERPQLYFNAARLNRSVAISGADYARLAQPRIEPIAGPAPGEPHRTTSP